MAKQPFNSAQGRLRLSDLSATGHHAKGNYGVDRLGLVSDSVEPAESPAHDPHEQSLSDALDATGSEHSQQSPSPQQREPAGPESDASPYTDRDQASSLSAARTFLNWLQERVPQFLTHKRPLAAGATGVACVLILSIWWLGHRQTPAPAIGAVAVKPAASPATVPAIQVATETPWQLPVAKLAQPEPPAPPAEPPSMAQPVDTNLALAHPRPVEPPPMAVSSEAPAPVAVATPPASEPASRPASQPAGDRLTPQEWRDCPPGYTLTGIMRTNEGPVAIINNHSVRVGKVVYGATLVRIGDFSVEMELDGKHFMLGVNAGDSMAQDNPDDKPVKKAHKAKKPSSKPVKSADAEDEDAAADSE